MWHEMLFGVLTFSFVLASVVCSVALVSMHRRRVRELTEQLAEAHRYEQLAYDAVCEERALRQELQRKCFDAEVRAEFFQRWAFVRSPERADPCHELTLEHFETGEAPWRPTSEDES